MFDRTYRSAMRNGSRLLFAIALLLFVSELLRGLQLFLPLGPDNAVEPLGMTFVGHVLNALSLCAWPLLGSLLIDRLDRRTTPHASDQDPA
ncbi:MAG TPA: hypothetical protein VF589_03380 [Allosphingosinicella sp.]|jgi:hypothetical protein